MQITPSQRDFDPTQFAHGQLVYMLLEMLPDDKYKTYETRLCNAFANTSKEQATYAVNQYAARALTRCLSVTPGEASQRAVTMVRDQLAQGNWVMKSQTITDDVVRICVGENNYVSWGVNAALCDTPHMLGNMAILAMKDQHQEARTQVEDLIELLENQCNDTETHTPTI